MNLYTINTGRFKLDGGAMFGVVPKSIWNKLNPADENNLCSWAMRSLLIEEGNRLVLIDTGIGDKQDAKFFGHYHLHGDESLDQSLAANGFNRNDITDVFLTHLHFDHCGGAIKKGGRKTGSRISESDLLEHGRSLELGCTSQRPGKSIFLKRKHFTYTGKWTVAICKTRQGRKWKFTR
ncbi:MAG: MBL fold metallo-hydrolase [Chitinophagaceae bacterium]|nr:MBL fold metallo-hydrolase [Chitinophagaceae bacterium]